MENVHGVDVSWLHQPNREHHHRTHAPSSPGLTRDVRPPTSSHGGLPQSQPEEPKVDEEPPPPPPAVAAAPRTPAHAPPPSTSSPNNPPKTSRRPGLLSRTSSERVNSDSPKSSLRRNSWMASISSKFSSQSPQSPAPSSLASSTTPQTKAAQASVTPAVVSDGTSANTTPPKSSQKEEVEELEPLQQADFVTLSDWLAIVPVKKLLLEDADLTDECLRVVLAGLLAAKAPERSKRPGRSVNGTVPKASERSGVVEKVTLKNNPKVTRDGWKHISLFLYMCRSLKAMDVSMIPFPQTLPPSGASTTSATPTRTADSKANPLDAAEIFFKALSERLGGSHLEELMMAECGLSAQQVRKVVDGAIICGITRLGLAGNHLDDEGLQHVVHYIQSGVCHGLDLGGNDLRGKLGMLADALHEKSPFWAVSLASCNLDAASLKPLLPALTLLENFRFIDLSHNRDLFSETPSALALLRSYIPQLKALRRLHLKDVAMSPKQAIALAEVLPEGPSLGHLNLLENPQLA
ncbi:Microtubules assembly and stabilization protein, partial [Cryomyces antarcticus]